MKNVLKSLSFLMVLGTLIFITSCGDDDGGGIIIDDDGDGGFTVSDGLYFGGVSSSGDTTIALAGELKETTVEGDGFSQLERAGHFTTFMYLDAGSYFFAEIDDQEVIATYGGTTTTVDTVKADNGTDSFGSIIDIELDASASASAITVSEAGMYHVVYDQQENEALLIKISSWGILGSGTDATDGDFDLTLDGTASADGATWSASNISLYSGGSFKLRYNDTWKVETREGAFGDAADSFDPSFGYVLFTNIGGTTDAPEIGAGNIDITEDGAYTVALSVSSNGELTITLTKTGDIEARPEFPTAMYLVGGATPYGWTEPGTGDNPDAALMHKVAGDDDGIYWKISSLVTGEGFKLSAINWQDPNLGFGNVTTFDADGITVSDDGGGNMSVAADGVYMIVLDLRDDEVKVSLTEVKVYGIGDAFGGFDEDVVGNLFTVDAVAKTVTSPALAASGSIRMYADHPWISDWWKAEFRVADGVIDYRNDGGDQEAVAGTAGQVITLSFDDNTGTIESP